MGHGYCIHRIQRCKKEEARTGEVHRSRRVPEAGQGREITLERVVPVRSVPQRLLFVKKILLYYGDEPLRFLTEFLVPG